MLVIHFWALSHLTSTLRAPLQSSPAQETETKGSQKGNTSIGWQYGCRGVTSNVYGAGLHFDLHDISSWTITEYVKVMMTLLISVNSGLILCS